LLKPQGISGDSIYYEGRITMAKPLLGEILLENGEISQDQLDAALEEQKKEGGLIGIILVNLGFISEQLLVKYLAVQAEKVVKSD
jgi:hypothetical protein